jgi:hypothetical protein
MGKLTGEGREGEGEGRKAEGVAARRRKGGSSAMGSGCMEELGPLLMHEPPVCDCCCDIPPLSNGGQS